MHDSERYLYKIFITISKFEHSNSRSNICIQLFGKSSSGLKSFKFPLVDPKDNGKAFQSGRTYSFEIEEAYIGKLKKIILTNQDPQSSGLHVKNIRVEIPELNKSWNFYCNQWLKKELSLTQDDIEEENKSPKDQWYGNTRYTIKILTSQCSKLKFDPMINVKIVGKSNETKVVRLNSTPSDNNKPKFQSGNIDIFRLEELDVESIEKVIFYCENDENGKMIDWYYDSITIDVPSKLIRYLFDRNSRTNLIKSSKETLIEIYPINVKNVSNQKNYCINMYISKVQHRSDFIQCMKMVVYGDYAISPEIKPCEFKTPSDRDCTNDQLVHFHHKRADLGPIYKVKLIVSIDKSKLNLFKNLNWFLNTIEIDYHKEKFIFEYKKWIKFKKYDLNKSLEFKIYEKNYSRLQKRTICTLSHRLLEESIKYDSYDDSFDEEEEQKKQSSQRDSPSRQKHMKREQSPTPRSKKNDLKSKLRFDQDLEDLASSDSTLSIVSSHGLKSSPKKGLKSPSKNHYENRWSDSEDFRQKTSPSPNSWKLSSKKERMKSEWSSDDEIKSNKTPTPRELRKISAKGTKKSEWSSDDDSVRSLSPIERKYIDRERPRFNDHPKRGKFSENLSVISSSRQEEFKRDKENLKLKKKDLKPTIWDEEYDQFNDETAPKFSSSLMNRYKPVSYTHLDVYKRQDINRRNNERKVLSKTR